MMRYQCQELRYGDTVIPYVIRRVPTRSTLAISVNPDGSVDVIAPKGTRTALIGECVRQKADWILRQREDFARQAPARVKEFVSGESLWYLGRQYTLKVCVEPNRLNHARVTLYAGRFRVTVSDQWDEPSRRRKIRDALERWYRHHARRHLAESVERFSRQLGLTIERIEVRDLAKRWGSCSSDGRVRFNWRIIMASRRLLDYVVAHELCHQRHPDHSRAFWQLLGRLLPDYERRRIELAVSGPKYEIY